jgi:hypothetical protein
VNRIPLDEKRDTRPLASMDEVVVPCCSEISAPGFVSFTSVTDTAGAVFLDREAPVLWTCAARNGRAR